MKIIKLIKALRAERKRRKVILSQIEALTDYGFLDRISKGGLK